MADVSAGAAGDRPGDRQALECMDQLDEYLRSMQELQGALRDGFFSLAQAQYALGPGSVSLTCCPVSLHATRTFSVGQGATDRMRSDGADASAVGFAVIEGPPRHAPAAGALSGELDTALSSGGDDGAAPQALGRLAPYRDEGEGWSSGDDSWADDVLDEAGHDAALLASLNKARGQGRRRRRGGGDPLAWFGALPPASLRRAQELFVQAVGAAARAATARAGVLSSAESAGQGS